MATKPPLPATPASGPGLGEIVNPRSTIDRQLTEAGEGDPTAPPGYKPDPNYYKFFGGKRDPLPGTGDAAKDALIKKLNDDAKRAQGLPQLLK